MAFPRSTTTLEVVALALVLVAVVCKGVVTLFRKCLVRPSLTDITAFKQFCRQQRVSLFFT